MRSLTLLATGLLLASLALAPGAAAEPDVRPAECPGVATAYPFSNYVDVRVTSFGCKVRVTLLGGVDCPAAADGTTSTSQGSITATAHCTPEASAAARPCPVQAVGSGSTRVSTNDCDVYVKLFDCVWGGGYNKKAEAGQFAVYLYECGPIGPPPATSAASAAPCSAAPGDTVSDDCKTISIRLVECVWDGYWHYHTTSPVAVREYRCGPPPA